MTLSKKEQYIVDADGKRVAVLLDIATYDKLIEELEDIADVRAYREEKPIVDTEIAAGNYVTAEELRKELEVA